MKKRRRMTVSMLTKRSAQVKHTRLGGDLRSSV